MRGTLSQSSFRGFAFPHPATDQTFLVTALIFTAVFSGCATVSADKTSANPAAAKISVVPSNIDFKAVVVGQKNSQTVKITNSGADSLGLERLLVSGAGFTLSAAKSPLTLAPGQHVDLSVVFAPSAPAEASGSLLISSSGLKTPVSVPLLGSGANAAPALVASPTALNFGTRAVKSSTSQSVTLKNTGNIAISINSVNLANPAFSISGLANGLSLSPDQKVEFQVWFRPSAPGNSSSTITVGTSSLPTPVKLAVAGSATNSTVAPPSSVPSHSVTLDWNASASSVSGYHVYRSESSSGPFERLTSSLVASLNYKDTSVRPGGRYYYVVTAVEADGSESVYSNEVSADIPST